MSTSLSHRLANTMRPAIGAALRGIELVGIVLHPDAQRAGGMGGGGRQQEEGGEGYAHRCSPVRRCWRRESRRRRRG